MPIAEDPFVYAIGHMEEWLSYLRMSSYGYAYHTYMEDSHEGNST